MPAPLVKYAFLFPFDIFCFLVKNQVFKDVWIDIGVFYLVPLVLLSVLIVFMSIPGCFQYCSSVVDFEVRNCDASRSSFIAQDCFGYPGFFLFCMKLSTVLLRSLKNFAGTLIGIALNL